MTRRVGTRAAMAGMAPGNATAASVPAFTATSTGSSCRLTIPSSSRRTSSTATSRTRSSPGSERHAAGQLERGRRPRRGHAPDCEWHRRDLGRDDAHTGRRGGQRLRRSTAAGKSQQASDREQQPSAHVPRIKGKGHTLGRPPVLTPLYVNTSKGSGAVRRGAEVHHMAGFWHPCRVLPAIAWSAVERPSGAADTRQGASGERYSRERARLKRDADSVRAGSRTRSTDSVGICRCGWRLGSGRSLWRRRCLWSLHESRSDRDQRALR